MATANVSAYRMEKMCERAHVHTCAAAFMSLTRPLVQRDQPLLAHAHTHTHTHTHARSPEAPTPTYGALWSGSPPPLFPSAIGAARASVGGH